MTENILKVGDKIYAVGTLDTATNITHTLTLDANSATGVLTFTAAPGNGLATKWGGLFYVPVQFTQQQLNISTEDYGTQAVKSIDLREIKQ